MMTDDFSRLGWLRYKVQAEFKELIWALLGFLQLDIMVAINFLIAAVMSVYLLQGYNITTAFLSITHVNMIPSCFSIFQSNSLLISSNVAGSNTKTVSDTH